MISKINELLTDQDNSEKIRDRIAAILKLELTKQKQLADELKIKDKKDFNINVYLENSRPWELTGDNEENNPFPLVNVCLQEINKDERSGSDQNNVKYTGIYYIVSVYKVISFNIDPVITLRLYPITLQNNFCP